MPAHLKAELLHGLIFCELAHRPIGGGNRTEDVPSEGSSFATIPWFGDCGASFQRTIQGHSIPLPLDRPAFSTDHPTGGRGAALQLAAVHEALASKTSNGLIVGKVDSCSLYQLSSGASAPELVVRPSRPGRDLATSFSKQNTAKHLCIRCPRGSDHTSRNWTAASCGQNLKARAKACQADLQTYSYVHARTDPTEFVLKHL